MAASRKAAKPMKCSIHPDREAVQSMQIHWQDVNRRGTFHLCHDCTEDATVAALWANLEARPRRMTVYDTLPPDALE